MKETSVSLHMADCPLVGSINWNIGNWVQSSFSNTPGKCPCLGLESILYLALTANFVMKLKSLFCFTEIGMLLCVCEFSYF